MSESRTITKNLDHEGLSIKGAQEFSLVLELTPLRTVAFSNDSPEEELVQFKIQLEQEELKVITYGECMITYLLELCSDIDAIHKKEGQVCFHTEEGALSLTLILNTNQMCVLDVKVSSPYANWEIIDDSVLRDLMERENFYHASSRYYVDIPDMFHFSEQMRSFINSCSNWRD